LIYTSIPREPGTLNTILYAIVKVLLVSVDVDVDDYTHRCHANKSREKEGGEVGVVVVIIW
jgi:hypothetical protein